MYVCLTESCSVGMLYIESKTFYDYNFLLCINNTGKFSFFTSIVRTSRRHLNCQPNEQRTQTKIINKFTEKGMDIIHPTICSHIHTCATYIQNCYT